MARGSSFGGSGGLVVAGEVEGELAEDLAGGGVDDGDVRAAGEDLDGGAGAGAADADVAAAAGGADGDGAVGVDAAGADVVAAGGCGRDGCGFGAGGVGGGGSGPVQGAVRAAGVVMGGEVVEQGLQGGQVAGLGGLGGEPPFEGLPEPLDLALGLGVAGPAVLAGDAQAG